MNGKDNCKKPRTIYAPQQVCYLEEKFAEQDFPNRTQRKMFAEHLHLSENHVQIWFQNKRAKQKRKQKIRARTEKKVHVPKPPSFWPQNLSFNSSLQVLESDSEDIVSSSSSDRAKNPSTISASNSSATSNQTSEETNSRRASNSSREASPVVVLNCFDRKGSREGDHVCQVKDIDISSAREHRMQFYSNGFTNGLRSSAPLAMSLQLPPHHHPANSIQIYAFKPEVIANPLLLLANCATQLHKARSTLSAKKNH